MDGAAVDPIALKASLGDGTAVEILLSWERCCGMTLLICFECVVERWHCCRSTRVYVMLLDLALLCRANFLEVVGCRRTALLWSQFALKTLLEMVLPSS